MNRKLLVSIAPLVAVIAFAVTPVAAQALTKELVSSGSNSLCVNPKPGFEPEIGGNQNYAPLTTPSSVPGEPFPDTGANCEPGFPTQAVPMVTGVPSEPGGPGKAAWPYAGKLPLLAEWVSYNARGYDFANVNPFNVANLAPKYYIYDETITLCTKTQTLVKPVLKGAMFADNRAGAFLNGFPIGDQTANDVVGNFDGPPSTGFPFAAVPADFHPSLNTLQFVVMDQSPPFTGLDFKAKVTWTCKGKKHS